MHAVEANTSHCSTSLPLSFLLCRPLCRDKGLVPSFESFVSYQYHKCFIVFYRFRKFEQVFKKATWNTSFIF